MVTVIKNIFTYIGYVTRFCVLKVIKLCKCALITQEAKFSQTKNKKCSVMFQNKKNFFLRKVIIEF